MPLPEKGIFSHRNSISPHFISIGCPLKHTTTGHLEKEREREGGGKERKYVCAPTPVTWCAIKEWEGENERTEKTILQYSGCDGTKLQLSP